jgi:hypothetical protein
MSASRTSPRVELSLPPLSRIPNTQFGIASPERVDRSAHPRAAHLGRAQSAPLTKGFPPGSHSSDSTVPRSRWRG